MLEFWAYLVFSFFLLIVAVALMTWHLKSWRSISQNKKNPKELDFHWRQFRRRMQCSAMLVVLAVAVFVGQWITAPPVLVIFFWGGTLLIVVWLVLLAVTDIIVTVHHFQGLRAECLIEQAKLKAEANRLRAAGGNGKPPRNKGN